MLNYELLNALQTILLLISFINVIVLLDLITSPTNVKLNCLLVLFFIVAVPIIAIEPINPNLKEYTIIKTVKYQRSKGEVFYVIYDKNGEITKTEISLEEYHSKKYKPGNIFEIEEKRIGNIRFDELEINKKYGLIVSIIFILIILSTLLAQKRFNNMTDIEQIENMYKFVIKNSKISMPYPISLYRRLIINRLDTKKNRIIERGNITESELQQLCDKIEMLIGQKLP